MTVEVLLQAKNLTKSYSVGGGFRSGRRFVHAVRGISLEVHRGETLAIVGESGCGKSTLARLLVGLEKADSGQLDVAGLEAGKRIPMVFQDSLGSLHPRRTVRNLIVEPLLIAEGRVRLTEDLRQKAKELAAAVGLTADQLDRLPHEISGGQRQRVNIARALASEAKTILLDEPLSALDVSIQAQILNLLLDLQESRELSIIFISHDLSVVRHFAHRTMVLYMGEVVESGPTSKVLQSPWHPYTKALLAADPSLISAVPEGAQSGLDPQSELPSPFAEFTGCPYVSRCSRAEDRCRTQKPVLEVVQGRAIACLPKSLELKSGDGNSSTLS